MTAPGSIAAVSTLTDTLPRSSSPRPTSTSPAVRTTVPAGLVVPDATETFAVTIVPTAAVEVDSFRVVLDEGSGAALAGIRSTFSVSRLPALSIAA